MTRSSVPEAARAAKWADGDLAWVTMMDGATTRTEVRRYSTEFAGDPIWYSLTNPRLAISSSDALSAVRVRLLTDADVAAEVAAAVAEERATTGRRIEAAKAAYEGKIQDLAVETSVNSAVTQWATRHSPSWNGDLADVGVDRGRQIAKRECLEVLLAAREAALANLRAALASPGEGG